MSDLYNLARCQEWKGSPVSVERLMACDGQTRPQAQAFMREVNAARALASERLDAAITAAGHTTEEFRQRCADVFDPDGWMR